MEKKSNKSNKSSKLRPNINVKVDELFLKWVNLPNQDLFQDNFQLAQSKSGEKSRKDEINNANETEETIPVQSPRRLNNTYRSNHNHTKHESRRSSAGSQLEESVAKDLSKKLPSSQKHSIPLFYFPNGKPQDKIAIKLELEKIEQIFKSRKIKSLLLSEMSVITECCGCPMYWKSLLFNAARIADSDFVTKDEIIKMWTNLIQNNHDEGSKFIALLSRSSKSYLEFDDFLPLLGDIVNTHPGLRFLKDAPEFHTRYMNTVIARIFYTVNRSWSGKITANELRRSNFLDVLRTLQDESDINAVTDYFSYEHFYVVYCKFWELDSDHNLIIDRNDLAKHGDGVLSMRLIDRVLSGAVTRSIESRNKGIMSYIDFVWFLISEEDKKLPTSLEYWFRCMDLDGDGIISLYEMEYFYEEQIRKLELLDIEALPFEDCVCQMLDMIKPSTPECVSLKDLKKSQMAYLFFDTFLNVEKYLQHEQKDPFANNLYGEDNYESQAPIESDWDKYAAEEYENLVAEEQANENKTPDNQSFYDDDSDPAIEAELRSLGLLGDDIGGITNYKTGEPNNNKKLAVQ